MTERLGYITKAHGVSGMCSIEFTAFSRSAEDTFAIFSVAQEANDLVEDCVANRAKPEGRKVIGLKQLSRAVFWHKHQRLPKRPEDLLRRSSIASMENHTIAAHTLPVANFVLISRSD